MYATEFQISPVQPSLPFFAPMESAAALPTRRLDECTTQRPSVLRGTAPQARLIRSVVEGAGLGKFVYLQGKSGRRYVFSSISNEQVSLYDRALFAATSVQANGVEIAARIKDLTGHCGALYVHLLDESDDDGAATLDDLCAV